MGQYLKKTVWYAIMCLSLFGGMYLLYKVIVDDIMHDNEINGGAALGLMMVIKYPTFFIMLLVVIFIGVVGFVGNGSCGKIFWGLRRTMKKSNLLYAVIQICLLLLAAQYLAMAEVLGVIAAILLSIANYTFTVWIENIFTFVVYMKNEAQ